MFSVTQPSWFCSFSWPFFMYILNCKNIFSLLIYIFKEYLSSRKTSLCNHHFLWLLLLFLVRIICNCVLRKSFFRMFYSSWAIFLYRIYHQMILNNFFPLALKMMAAIIEHLLNDRNFVCIISFILYHYLTR